MCPATTLNECLTQYTILIFYFFLRINKTLNLRLNVTLRRVRATIAAVEKQ
jgi:hypothetical protein